MLLFSLSVAVVNWGVLRAVIASEWIDTVWFCCDGVVGWLYSSWLGGIGSIWLVVGGLAVGWRFIQEGLRDWLRYLQVTGQWLDVGGIVD